MNTTRLGGALAIVLGALPVLLAQQAEGAGFAIREQSTSALGNAFASSPTGIEDVSTMFHNPAAMTFFTGNHLVATGAYIVPEAEFRNGRASTTPVGTTPPIVSLMPLAFGSTTLTSRRISNRSFFDGDRDIGRNAFVPATYAMFSLTDDLKAGIGINAPFGLLTDNPEGWIGRYHALKSQLETIDVNPALALRLTDYLSVGVGLLAFYANAELSQAVDFGTIGQNAVDQTPALSLLLPTTPMPTLQDGRAKLTGKDWAFGYNGGVMLEPGKLFRPLDGLRLGLGYRSRIELEIEGRTDFELDNAGIGATLNAQTGAFADTNAKTRVDLPDSFTIGAHYDINDQWAVMGQAEWTNWSLFHELVIEFDNVNQPDSVTDQEWEDSWFFALGTTYKPDWLDGLSLRLGVAWDQTPVRDRSRTPRIPDEDRYWIATGVGYAPFPWLGFDFGYTHIFLPDAEIDLAASDRGNQFRGNLSGDYEAQIDIFTVQGRLRF